MKDRILRPFTLLHEIRRLDYVISRLAVVPESLWDKGDKMIQACLKMGITRDQIECYITRDPYNPPN